MKYTLINCYSDNNKGDLGIILSTIQFLQKHDSDAIIKGVSTYNYSDTLFFTEHKLLSEKIDVFPSIFGELNIGSNKSFPIKILRFLFDSLRLLLLLIHPFSFLLSKEELKSFSLLQTSDYIISKGGSFLCNEQNYRTKISLIRSLYIFLLIFRTIPSAKVVLLCQSLGPVYGRLNRIILNFVLKKCYYIVLREDFCIKKYDYIDVPKHKTLLLNDIAFYLQSKPVKHTIQISDNAVGVTIKSVETSQKLQYQKMMVSAIEYLVSQKKANVYIFPHVTIDDDLKASFDIYKKVKDIYKTNIYILSDNYTSSELKYLYGKMNFLLATRLHSAIFALGEKIPAIVIAYHGTKAQGIYHNLGLDELLVVEYSSDYVIKLIDRIIDNRNIYDIMLKEQLEKYERVFLDAFNQIFVK